MVKVGQTRIDNKTRVVIANSDQAWLLPESETVAAILARAESGSSLQALLTALSQSAPRYHGDFPLLKPVAPPEIWACGVTYLRQAKEHDVHLRTQTDNTLDLYESIYRHPRVEVFFKGFDRSSAGPGEPLQLRADSKQVLPEAEIVLVLGKNGTPIGYTLGNDLTAWDIECDSPLFLNQAKIWDYSCSIGPFIVPMDERNLYDRKVECRVLRKGERIIVSEGFTRDLSRTAEELCHFLKFNNAVPPGTLLFTGTACVIPHDFALHDGDTVEVYEESVGMLQNTIRRAPLPAADYPVILKRDA